MAEALIAAIEQADWVCLAKPSLCWLAGAGLVIEIRRRGKRCGSHCATRLPYDLSKGLLDKHCGKGLPDVAAVHESGYGTKPSRATSASLIGRLGSSAIR